MAAKKPKKSEAANVYVSLYDGQLDLGFDCVGPGKCVHVRYYTDPPDPEEECAFLHNCSCTHAPARKAALEHLRERITSEIAENYEG